MGLTSVVVIIDPDGRRFLEGHLVDPVGSHCGTHLHWLQVVKIHQHPGAIRLLLHQLDSLIVIEP